jgi:hypothetical protein
VVNADPTSGEEALKWMRHAATYDLPSPDPNEVINGAGAPVSGDLALTAANLPPHVRR